MVLVEIERHPWIDIMAQPNPLMRGKQARQGTIASHDIIIERSKAEASAAAQMREIELKYAAGAYAGQPGFNGGGA